MEQGNSSEVCAASSCPSCGACPCRSLEGMDEWHSQRSAVATWGWGTDGSCFPTVTGVEHAHYGFEDSRGLDVGNSFQIAW